MNKQPSSGSKAPSLLLPLSFGAASLVVLLIAVVYLANNGVEFFHASALSQTQKLPSPISLLSPVSIHAVEKNAFGALIASSGGVAQASQSATRNTTKSGMGGGTAVATARAGGSGSAPTMAATPMMAQGVSESGKVATDVSASAPSATANDKIMPPIQQSTIEYAYTGDELKLDQTSMDVLRLASSPIPSANVSAIAGTNLGIADLSSFSNLKATDINLTQDVPFGYTVSIGYQSGMISIYQNWTQWQSVYPQCQDEKCWQDQQIKPSDVPSDDALIKIANDFLDQHHINRSSYGTPEVDRSWLAVPNVYATNGSGAGGTAVRSLASDVPAFANASAGGVAVRSSGAEGMMVPSPSSIAQIYVPDSIQITYPLLIQGKPVYNGSGMKVGMNVGVNLRAKRVSDVYNIRAMRLDASAYDAITDVNDVLNQAKKGGYNGYMYAMGERGSIVTQDLGTPTIGYLQIYSTKDNQSSELYVPAMIFPVKSAASNVADEATRTNMYYYGMNRNVVIVPLVKGVVDESTPIIRPMMDGGVSASGGGVSGSSEGSAPAGSIVTQPTPPIAPMMK
ncbi:MAG: hypothetical protein WC477_05345 [Patescibacteria group bacterium]